LQPCHTGQSSALKQSSNIPSLTFQIWRFRRNIVQLK